MTKINPKDIKKSVADFYQQVATDTNLVQVDINELNQALGYREEDLALVPEEANTGLGCGNPIDVAAMQVGETVLDLGAGKGMDAFISAKRVGDTGRVIGVDMTREMVDKAREIAIKRKFNQVEFRLGEIEHLPVADQTIDVAISNCVINLSTDKLQVYREIYRVLKPGGRIAISDISLSQELPDSVINNPKMYGT